MAQDGDEDLAVLGYLVVTPDTGSGGGGLPRVERLTSASDCLGERVPGDGCWFRSPEEARVACATAYVPDGARVAALLAAPADAGVLAREIRELGTYEPVLAPAPEDPPVSAEDGEVLGWEVVGYDWGTLHSWLCNDLYDDAVAELGVGVGPRGLLADRSAADRVAAWANARTDTKPVTWFAAQLVEWPDPIESTFVPVAPAPQPASWWRRLAERR